MRRPLLAIIATVCFLALPLSVGLYLRGETERTDATAEQQDRDCLQDQRAWDTLHALIETSAEPTAVPTQLDVIIPPATTPVTVTILPPSADDPPPDLSPYYALLKARPVCSGDG